MTASKCLLLALLTSGCGWISGDAKSLEQFASAECLPPSEQTSDGYRIWSETVSTASGVTVEIRGSSAPTGLVRIAYGPDDVVVAFARDFFAPTDVRFDQVSEQVLVRAEGSSYWGGGEQTLLLTYDLRKRQVLSEISVDPTKLPKGC